MGATSSIDGRDVIFDGLRWTYVDTGNNIENFLDTGTLCQGCGKIYKMDVIVSDNVWETIKPPNKPKGAGMLCGVCILTRLEQQLRFSCVHLAMDRPKNKDA